MSCHVKRCDVAFKLGKDPAMNGCPLRNTRNDIRTILKSVNTFQKHGHFGDNCGYLLVTIDLF